MTAKEKAESLVKTYLELGKDFTRGVSMNELAKECALIAVNEVLEYSQKHGFIGLTEYYQEVKQEIQKL
jgi:hypothetical protein